MARGAVLGWLKIAATGWNVTSSPIWRFFQTPKGLLIIVLALLVTFAAPREGFALVAPGLVTAVTFAGAIDMLMLRRIRGVWEFPSAAVLTGLIVAMVLTPHEPWYIAACTSAVAIAGKHIARTRSSNIFNPAALALVTTFYIFSFLSKIYGLIPVPEVVLTYDKGQFPSLCRCGSHRIVWLPLGSCC